MKFEVIGKIKSKQRPRVYNGRAITPKQTVDYENHVRYSFLASKNAKIKGLVPIHINIYCCFAVPKSYSNKKRSMCHSGEEKHLKKPDVDNVAKIVMDALNGYAYEDDKQIVSLGVEKTYTEEEEKLIIILNQI